jgi:phosphatidylglycerol:prolipoprotein diacylglycerol transferase
MLLWMLAIRRARTSFTRDNVEELLTWAIAGVLLGGRLGYMLLYDFGHFMDDPVSIFRVYDGGMAFHGGMTGAVLALLIVCRVRRLPFLHAGDLAAMAAPLGLFFGRLANFVNGELWGKVTDVSWAMIFPKAPIDTEAFCAPVNFGIGIANPRHPSQLYEAGCEGILLGALMLSLFWGTGLAKRIPGAISGIFLCGYAAARIVCEHFREPDEGVSLFLGLSRGTFYSLLMLATGLAVLLIAWLRRPRPGKPAAA